MKKILFILLILPVAGFGQLVKVLGMGAGVNNTPITVQNFTGTGFAVPPLGTLIHGVSDNIVNGSHTLDVYNDVSFTGPNYRGRRARGTYLIPTAVITDDILNALGGDGYGTSSFTGASTGSFNIRAEAGFTNTSKPTYLQFTVTASGSILQSEKMRLSSAGVLRVNSLNSVGVVQTDANGDFSTALLTNAQIVAALGFTPQIAGTYLTAANNLSDLVSAPTALTNLGGTTVGKNFFTLTNPSAVRYIKINADNTVSTRTAAQMLSDLGAGAGTVMSVSGTTNRISSTGGATPVIDIDAAYVGQTSITTLGTIGTGTWNGTAIANANLANSSITIGTTTIVLGGTSLTLGGLTSVSATTFTGALSGNASTATALATGRTISGTGDATFTTGSFDGTGNATGAVTVSRINGVALSGLATGILKNTTVSGVPSIASAIDFPTLNQNTTGSAGSVLNSLGIGAELIAGGATTYNGSLAKTLAIQTNSVTNTMLSQMATATFKGRTTAGTGNAEDLTVTQATALLNSFTGDSGAGGVKGIVPAPAAGDAAANKFLNANGTWVAPPGAGSGLTFAQVTALIINQ